MLEEGGQYRIIGHAATEHLFGGRGVVTLIRIDPLTRAGDGGGYDVIYWCKAEGFKHNLPLYHDELEPAE